MARETVKLTYAGRRETTDGKMSHLYYDGAPERANERLFKRALYPASPGAHITFEAERHEDGSMQVYSGTGSFAGRVDDDTLAAQWAAEDRAVVGAAEARKMAKAVDPFKETLAPLKDVYMNSTPVQRAALVTAVIREMTSWS